jgi:hypothetical protein
MWQICGHIPQTLHMLPDITCIAAQLSVSFFIETFIHAKEKVSGEMLPWSHSKSMSSWVEHFKIDIVNGFYIQF